MRDTKIEWADDTFNPWRGCQKIAPGCKFCYAEKLVNGRMQGDFSHTRVKPSEAYWRQPLKWNRDAEFAAKEMCGGSMKPQHRRRVFCASLADVFEDWQGPIVDAKGSRLFSYVDVNASATDGSQGVTMNDLRRDLFALIDKTPWLDWLLLTKRPENIRKMFPEAWPGVPYRNVWLGTSVSEQATADENIPALLACRDLAPVLFVSYEPALGPIIDRCNPLFPHDPSMAHGWCFADLDWLIVGGESGPHARPCDVAWIRSARDQCNAAGVACFIKQLGSEPMDCAGRYSQWPWLNTPTEPYDMESVRLRDKKGGDWSEWPEDLRVREMPSVNKTSKGMHDAKEQHA